MKTLTLCIATLILAAGMASADRPPVVALSSMTGVCVKLTDTSGYKPGTAVAYEIRHWPDNALFTSGTVKADSIRPDAYNLSCFNVDNLKPKLWSPQDPQLYMLSVTDSTGHELGKTRFGFRTFEAKGLKLYLNGRPIFIRGDPISPPGREVPAAAEHNPEFIRGYIKLLKSAGVNMIRTEPQDWLDACDELGMMLFAGSYGGIHGGEPPSADAARPFFENLMLGLASHPGVVIYVLTNEVDYTTKPNTNVEVITKIREDLRKLDPTRPVIGNAGFGHGKPGEIFDVHRYPGWYHGSMFDWYNDLRGYLAEAKRADQPFTMTECVGAYTSDAGDFESMAKQMSTRMMWVGTAKDPRTAALDYQAELVRQIVEINRRYRTATDSIAGVMPFTYLLGWSSAKVPEDLIIKPAFEVLKTVFQPILISPECWHRDLYAGDNLKMRLCVINDADSGRDIGPSQAVVELAADDGRVIASTTVQIAATPYYSNTWADAALRIPNDLPRGYYDVRCKLLENGAEISHNSFEVAVAPRAWVKASPVSVTLFDPSGKTAKALQLLGVNFEQITNLRQLPKEGTLVIGEGALAPGIYPAKRDVAAFLGKGGRILCLRQDREKWNSDWLPANFTMDQRKPYRPFAYIQPRENAAIYRDLSDRDLRYWNELGRLRDTTPDACPVLTALKPATLNDLRSARVWASCDQLLGSAAMLEIYEGSGSVVLSQFRMVERVSDDPMAAKLLSNLVTYTTSAKTAGLLDLTKPVLWDQEAFRSGAFVSPLQGFLPHSKTYKHDGGSKGLMGADHSIDGFTMVGKYGFKNTGWLIPVPDPAADGWGVLYGTLSRPVTSFDLKLSNLGDTPARISLKIDGKPVGAAMEIPAGVEKTVQWPTNRASGPIEVELRGDQRLLITESCFK